MKIRNLIKALIEQGPIKRAYKNFIITRNAWGMFHRNSHQRVDNGKVKVTYNTKKTALKAAEKLSKKYDTHFSAYKCIFCDGYHIGKNRANKIKKEKVVIKTAKIIPINSIIPQKIEEFRCELFAPYNISLGFFTQLELLAFRVQIRYKKFSGYYLIYKREKIYIDEDGCIEVWPDGFYDQHEKLLKELIGF